MTTPEPIVQFSRQNDNSPCAVVLTIDEGDGIMAEMELVYPTRFQAEMFVALIPMLQMEQVKSAILSPLVEVGAAVGMLAREQ